MQGNGGVDLRIAQAERHIQLELRQSGSSALQLKPRVQCLCTAQIEYALEVQHLALPREQALKRFGFAEDQALDGGLGSDEGGVQVEAGGDDVAAGAQDFHSVFFFARGAWSISANENGPLGLRECQGALGGLCEAFQAVAAQVLKMRLVAGVEILCGFE